MQVTVTTNPGTTHYGYAVKADGVGMVLSPSAGMASATELYRSLGYESLEFVSLNMDQYRKALEVQGDPFRKFGADAVDSIAADLDPYNRAAEDSDVDYDDDADEF